MKVTVKGGGDINLTKSHFLAGGGQGNVYVVGNTAYKIYNDPVAMMPLGKIQELSIITDPNIITPQAVLLDTKQIPVGYSMRFVKDTHILCTLFTRAFKERNGLTQQQIQDLVLKFREIVDNVHKKDILIVDLNELNFLADQTFSTIYAIDTDSYQTRSYPATVIMDSVRDWRSKGFSKETDWFSFGIIAFQMMISIHPFKGSHTVKGLKERMLQNISVFNKDVSIPKMCYPLDSIPESYRSWFKAVFEDGKRIAPPLDFSAHVAAHIVNRIVGNDVFNIDELMDLEGNINSVYIYGAVSAVLTDKKFYLNRREISVGTGLKLCIPPKSDTVFLAKIQNGLLKLFNTVTKEELLTQIAASETMVYHGQLYVKNCDKILEIDIMEGVAKTLVSGRQVANVLESASTMYDGVVVQNLLGSYYVSVFPTPKVHRQIRIKELDGYKVIDAKFDRNVLMLVGTRNGTYDRFVYKFTPDWSSYVVKITNDITFAGLNFVTLDTGVCVHITEDEKINVFYNRHDVDSVTEISNNLIGGDMKLFASGSKLLFGRQNKLYSMSMRSK